METKGARSGQLFEFVHDQPGLPRAYKSLAEWAAAMTEAGAGKAASRRKRTKMVSPTPSDCAALPWDLACDLSFAGSTWVERAPIRSSVEVRAMDAGTALRWRLEGSNGDGLGAVKLGNNAWCFATRHGMSDLSAAVVRSLTILAGRVPQTAWRQSDEDVFGRVYRAPTPVATATAEVTVRPADGSA